MANNWLTWENPKTDDSDKKYYCKDCDYYTNNKKDLKKHIETIKHKKIVVSQNLPIHNEILHKPQKYLKDVQHKYECLCGNVYSHVSSLCKHKKKCKINSNDNSDELLIKESETTDPTDIKNLTKLFMETLTKNQEFQKQMFDMMKETIQTTTNTNINNTIMNNNSNNNNKFNMNFFLNETCKDAMNLSEFVESLHITVDDLENVGKLGYTEGISRIFTNGLKALDVSKRPIHCSDVKREVVYVKNDNMWVKETDQLRKAIKLITNKNIKLIPKWKEANPGHHLYHNKRNDDYLKIMYESMGPTDEAEEKKFFSKIISNLAKETVIHKT